MACSASLLPGACALRSIEEAQVVCLAAPECRAITVFLNGGQGRCERRGAAAAAQLCWGCDGKARAAL